MNKKTIIISFTILLTILIGGYFVVTSIQIRQSELELLDYLNKPEANIGLWNKTNKKLHLKLTNENGQLRWFNLDPGGGSAGSYDIGKVKIERVDNEKSLYSINLELHKGADIDFNVYDDKIEPR